jgi:hypothetical protein
MDAIIHWDTNVSIPDENVDEWVDATINRKYEDFFVGNMLVVDALRVRRKRGVLTSLTLELPGGEVYEVDSDGRWVDGKCPEHLYLYDKYLMELL